MPVTSDDIRTSLVFLDVSSGEDMSLSGHTWVVTQSGHTWVVTQSGHAWVVTQSGHTWVVTQSGHAWVVTQSGLLVPDTHSHSRSQVVS